jgi:hypothetical protein
VVSVEVFVEVVVATYLGLGFVVVVVYLAASCFSSIIENLREGKQRSRYFLQPYNYQFTSFRLKNKIISTTSLIQA